MSVLKKEKNMALDEAQKEIKKEFATYKRKISEIAGEIHDIVEDRIWTDYGMLPSLSEDIQKSMKEMLEFKAQHEFLK
jgi:hypothetical protein